MTREQLVPISSFSDRQHQQQQQHPLMNLCVLELGAGCGVPSFMALKCGAAAVVCTDLDNPNRIRCLAEAMERNWREMHQQQQQQQDSKKDQRYPVAAAAAARVCPFRWGSSTERIVKVLQEILSCSDKKNANGGTTPGKDDERRPLDDPSCCCRLFDVICATDCLFMPWLHYELLEAVQDLLASNGVAIFAFAVHEAFSKDEQVWPFVDKAKEKGFDVEILPAVQLTPPRKGMDVKQGLVHQLRLTRRSQNM